MIRLPPISTRTYTRFPYTPLCRSGDVAVLLRIAERDQIIGVGGVLVARMDRQETLRRRGRRRIFAVHIIGKSAHQLRAARPGRIGMLALDLVEQRRGVLVLAAIEPVLRPPLQGADFARDRDRNRVRQAKEGYVRITLGRRRNNKKK